MKVFNSVKLVVAFAIVVLFSFACEKESVQLDEPYYYFEVEFQGDTIRKENNDLFVNAFSNGPGEPSRIFTNEFDKIYWRITFEESVTENDK